MLYKIAHILRDKLPWIWDTVGIINSFPFGLRYGSRMKNIQNILPHFTKTIDKAGNALSYRIESFGKDNLPMLAEMLAEQSMSAFDLFKPYGFDELSLNRLTKDKGLLAYIVTAEGAAQQRICAGYFFQRSPFWGKPSRGYMAGYHWQHRRINKMVNLCAAEISSLLGLRVFGTIALNNIASMKSAQATNNIQIIKRLPNGDYYVEYRPREDQSVRLFF